MQHGLGREFLVEFADTEVKREYGLMCRRAVAGDRVRHLAHGQGLGSAELSDLDCSHDPEPYPRAAVARQPRRPIR